jgi:hypothetical protein
MPVRLVDTELVCWVYSMFEVEHTEEASSVWLDPLHRCGQIH